MNQSQSLLKIKKGIFSNSRKMQSLSLSIAVLCSTILTVLSLPAVSKTSYRECSRQGVSCGHGRVCVGPEDDLRCKVPMTVGKSCNVDPYWICEKSLICENMKCVIPEKGGCFKNEDACSSGTVCAGLGAKRQCVRPVGHGQPCGRDPFCVCESNLKCEDGMCVIPTVPAGGSCLESGAQCSAGTSCAGSAGNKVCVVPVGTGKQCGGNPFEVCEEKLQCNSGVCEEPRVKFGEDCSATNAQCENGTVCAGRERNRRCVIPMRENEKCGKDKSWVCESGLECVDYICRTPRIDEKGDCLPEGSRCAEGLICAGRPDKKKCVKPMNEGERCKGDPFWVCREGLECVDQICVKPTIPKHGDCLQEGAVCENGTVCVSNGNISKCVEPMSEGKQCGKDPFWICEDGLSCIGNTCAREGGGVGDDCSRDGFECNDGLVCAGTARKRRCVKPVELSGKCSKNVRRSCSQGLSCVNDECVKIARHEEHCGSPGTICDSTTVCAGSTSENKKCVRPMEEGKACGSDPFWVCGLGLKCVSQKCIKVSLEKGDRCIGSESVCPRGTVCAGDYPSKQCVQSVREGRRCGRKWWQVCDSGLTCVDHRCRKTYA